MTVRTETTKVRISKEVAARRKTTENQKTTTVSDERESRAGSRASGSSRQRRDRITPEGMRRMPRADLKQSSSSTSNGGRKDRPRRRKTKNRKNLKIDVKQDPSGEYGETPTTAASTPTSPGVRGNSDMRSPGQRKTPLAKATKVDSEENDVPDFIAQTDRFGNATTPRSQTAIEKARAIHPSGPKPRLHVGPNGKLTEEAEEEEENVGDVCAETLMDSIRLMCCCFVPEDGSSEAAVKSQIVEQEEPEVIDADKPRLLPKLHPDDHGKKCLVLDLDETLVHSSFRAVPGADFVIPVQIEDVVHFVYVAKRPGVDEFLIEMAKHYEVVIYTASLNKYADPLLDLLDPNGVIRARLFRESCVYYDGNYVKDLSLLDRDLSQAVIVDNSPSSYIFHPENAIDCSSFIDDPDDRELDMIASFLIAIKDVEDVRGVAPQWREWPEVNSEEQQ